MSTTIFRSNIDSKAIKRKVVWHHVGAPSKEEARSLESYVQFELVPQYNGLIQYYNNYDLCLDILLNGTSVDEEFFRNMDDILKRYCPALIGRYKIVKM